MVHKIVDLDGVEAFHPLVYLFDVDHPGHIVACVELVELAETVDLIDLVDLAVDGKLGFGVQAVLAVLATRGVNDSFQRSLGTVVAQKQTHPWEFPAWNCPV